MSVRGSVKWFSESKGYGFLVIDGTNQDVFVHYSEIAADGFKTLQDGDRVEFELEQGKRGDKAVKVRKI